MFLTLVFLFCILPAGILGSCRCAEDFKVWTPVWRMYCVGTPGLSSKCINQQVRTVSLERWTGQCPDLANQTMFANLQAILVKDGQLPCACPFLLANQDMVSGCAQAFKRYNKLRESLMIKHTKQVPTTATNAPGCVCKCEPESEASADELDVMEMKVIGGAANVSDFHIIANELGSGNETETLLFV
jgi:hypothetical protein